MKSNTFQYGGYMLAAGLVLQVNRALESFEQTLYAVEDEKGRDLLEKVEAAWAGLVTHLNGVSAPLVKEVLSAEG